MMQRYSDMRVLLPVLSRIKAMRGEERRAQLPKIQSGDETAEWLRGNWTRSACSQDQAGVLCHNKGRRVGERKKEWRERENEREREGGRGPTALRAQTIGGGLAFFFFFFVAARTEVEGRKGEGVDLAERDGKKEEEKVISGSHPRSDIW